jgi:hypothetical protein
MVTMLLPTPSGASPAGTTSGNQATEARGRSGHAPQTARATKGSAPQEHDFLENLMRRDDLSDERSCSCVGREIKHRLPSAIYEP